MPEYIKNLFESFDFVSFWSDIIKSLIIAAITGLIAVIFTKKYINKISFVNEFSKFGFLSSISNKNISEKEYRHIFSHADTIKMIFVTGMGFFADVKKQEMIKKALRRGAKIEILLARKNNPFLKDIKNMEHDFSYRPFYNDIEEEVDAVHKILDGISDGIPNKVSVKYFSTEYRLPLVIATFDDGTKNAKTSAWLNVTLPPAKAKEHILFRIECKNEELQGENDNFVYMLVEHFNTIWNVSSSWEDTAEPYWAKKYQLALESTVSDPKKILIEVSSQHPLIGGQTPSEEFCKRMDAGIELYSKLKKDRKSVKFYIPGSLHSENGVSDLISLSEAGKRYLLDKGIAAEDIYAEEINIKYKGKDGVYNSADECYASAMLYKDEGFEELYCFCSPMQVLKKQLFYIENDILAKIYSVPVDGCLGNPFFQAGVIVPEVVFYDHSWQNESYYGIKSRKERKPRQ